MSVCVAKLFLTGYKLSHFENFSLFVLEPAKAESYPAQMFLQSCETLVKLHKIAGRILNIDPHFLQTRLAENFAKTTLLT